MQKSNLMRSADLKSLKPLSENPEFKELLEALKAVKSEPAFKEAIKEFRKKHTGLG